MTLTKEQRLEHSKIQDRLFSAPVSYRPGEPCDHPGCASHLSHPCEGCGRYAAGMQDGPDIAAGRRHIYKMALDDPVFLIILRLREEHGWSWEQAMIAIIIKQFEINKVLTDRLNEVILNRSK